MIINHTHTDKDTGFYYQGKTIQVSSVILIWVSLLLTPTNISFLLVNALRPQILDCY